MRWLLDVNVLVALSFPAHSLHTKAQNWYRQIRNRPWASCALTQAGYFRSATHILGTSHGSISKALEMLEATCRSTDHEFWNTHINLLDLNSRERSSLIGKKQVADMQLLMLAFEKSAQLATFDTGIQELAKGTRFEKSLLLI